MAGGDAQVGRTSCVRCAHAWIFSRELPPTCGTLWNVRWGSLSTLGVSVLAHGAVAAILLAPRFSLRSPPPLPVDPAPAMAGESFELRAPESADTPVANASPSPHTNAAPAPIDVPDAPGRVRPPERATPSRRPSPGGAGSSALFGAVGDRSAADLTRAFTRGFPQAASGDPAWKTVTFGSAGDATLVLTLDDAGHIQDVQVLGSPSTALAQGIRRTLSLIKGRPFTARGKVTKLRLSATVIPNTVPDGLHGDVFAIGAGDDEGFFALSVGRRIELHVRPQ